MSGIREVFRYKINCPSCGKESLNVVEFIYDTPYFGKLLVSTTYCSNCGYRSYDTLNLESSEHIRIEVKVESPEALNSLVIRGKKGIIRIPELDIEITPGPISDPFITTIEGVLYRILEAMSALDDSEECRRVRENLEKAMRGELKFTFIVEDPTGGSMVIPKGNTRIRVERIKMVEQEL